MKPSIRIYAPSIGNGSWTVVARGIASAARHLGHECHLYPTDISDPDTPRHGAGADVALVVGRANGITLARLAGSHRHLAAMLAPNAEAVSPTVLRWLAAEADEVLTPSTWGERVIRRCWDFEQELDKDVLLTVVPHGVHEAFTSPTPGSDVVPYTMLHFAGSDMDRKGTFELLEAYAAWEHMEHSSLIVVAPGMAQMRVVEWAAARPGVTVYSPEQFFDMDLPWPERSVNQYHNVSCVVQPSRAEGFGMVPLEALACGVPVITTCWTGQEDYLMDKRLWATGRKDGYASSWVPVATKGEGPLESEGFMPAQVLDTGSLAKAIDLMYRHHKHYKANAMAASGAVWKHWSWVARTAHWLDTLEEKCRRSENRQRLTAADPTRSGSPTSTSLI